MVEDQKIVLRLKIGDEIVDFLTFEADQGVTPEKQALMSELRAHAASPAEQVIADADGCRLVWAEGWPFVFTPPAWKTWWGDRPPVRDLEACYAFIEFERYLYGDEVVGGKLDSAIVGGRMSLWDAVRDFPETILHSTAIQQRLYQEYASGRPVTQRRGKRSREDRQATLDRWMTTVSRVEEFRRKGYSLADAFAALAKAERRGGRNPEAQIRGEYERGKRWRHFFIRG